jgi:hypothetical protein
MISRWIGHRDHLAPPFAVSAAADYEVTATVYRS